MYKRLLAVLFICAFASVSFAQNTNDPRVRSAETAYARGEYEIALENWLALANDGDTEAKYFVGMLHEFGKGTPLDLKQAYRWYLEAANGENPRAQFKIAEIYETGHNGIGGIGDIQRAVQWWQRSADNGYASAKLKLGWAYYNGIGVEQDRARAAELIAGASLASTDVPAEVSNGERETFSSEIKPNTSEDETQEIKVATLDSEAPTVTQQPIQNAQTIDGDSLFIDLPTDVVSSNLNSAVKLMTAAPGAKLKIVTRAGKRVLVRVPGGVPLWVSGKYVKQSGKTGDNTGTITGEGVRARPRPSSAANAAPMGTLQRGERVRVLSEQNGWIKIIAPERIAAWVNLTVPDANNNENAAETPVEKTIEKTVVATAAPVNLTAAKTATSQSGKTNAANRFGKILLNETPVLALPASGATKLITLRKDTPIRLLQKQGDWYRIAAPGGLPVWVYGKYVNIQSNNRGKLSGSGVRARALPGTGAKATVVGAVGGGDLVQVVGQKNNWYYVLGLERLSGWVRSDQIRTGVEDNTAEWGAFAQIVQNDAFKKFEQEF